MAGRPRAVLIDNMDHLPLLAASIVPTDLNPTLAQMATRATANRNLMVVGTNAANTAYVTTGGAAGTLAGGAADQNIIRPHTTTGMFPSIQWTSGRRPLIDYTFRWATIAGASDHFAAGFKLATADLTQGVDADEAMFFIDRALSTELRIATAVNGTDDTVINTGITVLATQTYRVIVEIKNDGRPYYYVGVGSADPWLVHRGSALDAAETALIPVAGLQDGGGGDASVIHHKRMRLEIDLT